MEEELSLFKCVPCHNVIVRNGRRKNKNSAREQQKQKREISTSFKIFITAWAFVENGLFSGLRAGWSALVYVLKQEHIYASLCDTDSSGNFTAWSRNESSSEIYSSGSSNISWDSNNTIRTNGCDKQDDVFNQCFTVATATMALSALMYGQLNYKFGIRVPRVLSVIIFVGGACCFAFIDKDLPWLVFPGLLLISSGGMALYITNNQISYMYTTGSAAVVGLLCGALEASSIMQTIIKILYEHGISLFISYLTLAGLYSLTLISTIFFLPKDFINSEKNAEIVEVVVPASDPDQQTMPIEGSSETVNESKLGDTDGVFKIKRNDNFSNTFNDTVNDADMVNSSKIIIEGTNLFINEQSTEVSQRTDLSDEVSQQNDDVKSYEEPEGTSLSNKLSQGHDLSHEASQPTDFSNELSQEINVPNQLSSQGTDIYNEASLGTSLPNKLSQGNILFHEATHSDHIANTKSDGKYEYVSSEAKVSISERTTIDPQSFYNIEDINHLERDVLQTENDAQQIESQEDAQHMDVTSTAKLSESDGLNEDQTRDENTNQATNSHNSESKIGKEKTLLKCLLTKTFFLYLFWAVAVQIILSMSLGTFNPWLEYVTNNDNSKVSEFTDVLFYSMLGSPVLALCFGLAMDAMKRVKPGDNKSENVRTLQTATVSLGLTSVLGVLLCGFFMTCNGDVIVATSIALVVFRTVLYSCGTAFLRIMYPTHYFGVLCGITSMLAGTLSFLQYPLFIWVQDRDQAWMEVFGFLGIVGIISLIHPAYLYWKSRMLSGASYSAKQNSYERLKVESPDIQETE